MLSKSLRLPLFGLLGLAAVGLGASLFFFDDEDSTDLSANNTPVVEAAKPEPKPFTLKLDDTIGFKAPESTTSSSTDEESGESEEGDSPTVAIQPDKAKTETKPVVASTKGKAVKYTVKSGDVLGRIIRKFGCSIDDVKRLNPQMKDVNKIVVGRTLVVLDNKGIGGEALETQANASVETPPATVSSSSDSSSIKPEPIVAEKNAPTKKVFRANREHKLRNGDTYFTISQLYYGDPTYWKLVRDANPDWDIISPKVGSTIIIPALDGDNQPVLVEKTPGKADGGLIPTRN